MKEEAARNEGASPSTELRTRGRKTNTNFASLSARGCLYSGCHVKTARGVSRGWVTGRKTTSSSTTTQGSLETEAASEHFSLSTHFLSTSTAYLRCFPTSLLSFLVLQRGFLLQQRGVVGWGLLFVLLLLPLPSEMMHEDISEVLTPELHIKMRGCFHAHQFSEIFRLGDIQAANACSYQKFIQKILKIN